MKKTLILATLVLFAACNKSEPPPAAPATATNTPPKPPPPTRPQRPPLPIPAPDDVAAPPADATKLPDGLAFKVLTPGTGTEHPTADSTVIANYTGWTTDGKAFDSTQLRGMPNIFNLKQVIPGWTEVLQQMVDGEKVRAWIPEALAYKGMPGRPAGMLVFDIELIGSMKHEPPGQAPEAPKDVAAPPKDATKTASGLAYKVLKKGTGTEHPTPNNAVVVDYTGWTTDGKAFDSSVRRGQPAIFPVGQVIPGWTEGLQLMTVGEKARFWIPEDLAYKGQPGPPKGMLVFDVDLYKILPGPPARPALRPVAPGIQGHPQIAPGHPATPPAGSAPAPK